MKYIEKLNELERLAKEEKEAIYEEYGENTDDAELCCSQVEEEYSRQINELANEAERNGVKVRFVDGEWRPVR